MTVRFILFGLGLLFGGTGTLCGHLAHRKFKRSDLDEDAVLAAAAILLLSLLILFGSAINAHP